MLRRMLLIWIMTSQDRSWAIILIQTPRKVWNPKMFSLKVDMTTAARMNVILKVEVVLEEEPALETQRQLDNRTNNSQAKIRPEDLLTTTRTPNPIAVEVVKTSSKWEVQEPKVRSKDMINNKIMNLLSKVMSSIAKGWEIWVRGDKVDKCSQIVFKMHLALGFTKGDPWRRNTMSRRMSPLRWMTNLLSQKPTEISVL